MFLEISEFGGVREKLRYYRESARQLQGSVISALMVKRQKVQNTLRKRRELT